MLTKENKKYGQWFDEETGIWFDEVKEKTAYITLFHSEKSDRFNEHRRLEVNRG
ncbi:hypothetical protein [Peribacillus aracenensis]|uniref:hypothetical protein n=1 Tax=Peribacillus aracenensis TaxID=2976708 RepID=UPI0021A2F765|nr:hypothetical protein [Peribacillus sp. BBB004]